MREFQMNNTTTVTGFHILDFLEYYEVSKGQTENVRSHILSAIAKMNNIEKPTGFHKFVLGYTMPTGRNQNRRYIGILKPDLIKILITLFSKNYSRLSKDMKDLLRNLETKTPITHNYSKAYNALNEIPENSYSINDLAELLNISTSAITMKLKNLKSPERYIMGFASVPNKPGVECVYHKSIIDIIDPTYNSKNPEVSASDSFIDDFASDLKKNSITEDERKKLAAENIKGMFTGKKPYKMEYSSNVEEQLNSSFEAHAIKLAEYQEIQSVIHLYGNTTNGKVQDTLRQTLISLLHIKVTETLVQEPKKESSSILKVYAGILTKKEIVVFLSSMNELINFDTLHNWFGKTKSYKTLLHSNDTFEVEVKDLFEELLTGLNGYYGIVHKFPAKLKSTIIIESKVGEPNYKQEIRLETKKISTEGYYKHRKKDEILKFLGISDGCLYNWLTPIDPKAKEISVMNGLRTYNIETLYPELIILTNDMTSTKAKKANRNMKSIIDRRELVG